MEPVLPPEYEVIPAKPVVLNEKEIKIIIPQCCLENWPTCKHVPRRNKKVKKNIGL